MKIFYTIILAVVVIGIGFVVFSLFSGTTVEAEIGQHFPFVEKVEYQKYFGEPDVYPLNDHGELVVEFNRDENSHITIIFSTSTLPVGNTLEDFFYNHAISIEAPDKVVYFLDVSGKEAITGSLNEQHPLYFYEILYNQDTIFSVFVRVSSTERDESIVQYYRELADNFVSEIVFN